MPISASPNPSTNSLVTYVPIANYTASGSANSITFGSGGTLTQAYTDLVLIISGGSSTNTYFNMYFNGDTAQNYSRIGLSGNGGSAAAFAPATQSRLVTTNHATGAGTTDNINEINIMNYSSSNTNKIIFSNGGKAASGVTFMGGLWRSNAAITSITVDLPSGLFQTGTTFNLYGIRAG